MGFSLDMPAEEDFRSQVEKKLEIPQGEVDGISDFAKKQSEEIMSVSIDDPESRREIADVVEHFGLELLDRSEAKNAVLGRQISLLAQDGGESGGVAAGLESLSKRMEALDPSGIDFTKGRGLFGIGGNPARRYFDQYRNADDEIAAILESLEEGKRTLRNDNITLELEEAAMLRLTGELTRKIRLGIELDDYLSALIGVRRGQLPSEEELRKLQFVEEEVLFPLRQRIMDMQQLLVVNQQGIIAMSMVRKNNNELIRAVDRARNVTVTSLRVAVTVAQALCSQKIVLEKVTMLNEATNRMISATAGMLRGQGTAIQSQAAGTGISSETLKQSFADTLAALDEVSRYRRDALPQMEKSIRSFQELASAGASRLGNR